MIKTILVAATGSSADAPAFRAAVTAARLFDAHLDFLHVRIDPAEIATKLATLIGGGRVSMQLIEELESDATGRESRVHESVRQCCKDARLPIDDAPAGYGGVTARWCRELGDECRWICEYGRTSDLIVIGRSTKQGRGDLGTLEVALLDTGRPLLMPGGALSSFETMVIAWKSTRQAARAVAAAWPFLAKAERVVILTVAEDHYCDRESAARLLATLRRHNIATEVRYLEGVTSGAADALLATAAEIGAGLLVMGGYSHSWLREFVFGGVTTRVLRGADLPVLMAH